MIEEIRKFYIQERIAQVDADFLEFEEQQSSREDLVRFTKLLSRMDEYEIKLPNPHNSILLYVCGLTEEFDFQKARSDTKGGSPPDIDIDFDTVDREKAVEWAVNHWGRENVAHIITHGTFKPKSTFKDWYRVTEGPGQEIADILRNIPKAKFGKEPSLEEVVKAYPAVTKLPVWEHAEKLHEMVKSFGIHAGGVVISHFPIMEHIPVWANKTSDRITQFDKDEVEELGLIKFDFLGIDCLSILKEAARLIKKNHGVDVDIYRIEDGDTRAYQLLNEGMFAGIFQMEGPGSGVARRMLQKVQPENIEMISDISALNRPGPIQAGLDAQYVENRLAGYAPNEMPEAVQEVLGKTFWTLVYQEQVMHLCSKLAGFTLKEADDIRRAMGKKDKEKLLKYKAKFLDGCKAKNLVDVAYADDLWSMLEGFADYCFNKSHSLAYSYLTYVTAWFKANYPAEFFCALMTVRSQVMMPQHWAAAAPEYLAEASKLGIKINPPSVNGSEESFTIKGNEIFFGLSGIRDCGVTAVRSIIQARGNKPFDSVMDFLQRVNLQKVNSKVFIALVKAGAFDRMGYQRRELADAMESLYGYVRGIVEYQERKLASEERARQMEQVEPIVLRKEELKKKSKKKGVTLTPEEEEFLAANESVRRLVPLKLGDAPVEPTLQRHKRVTLTLQDIMEQAHYVGCYIGQHPARMIHIQHSNLVDLIEGDQATVAGVVNTVKEITTKATKQKMAFITLDDSTAIGEVTVFSGAWNQVGSISPGDLIVVNGTVEETDDEIKIKARSVQKYRSNQ